MDPAVIEGLLETAARSLGLDAPLHPWWLDEVRPVRPPHRSGVLAAPCPAPVDLELDALLEGFVPDDRPSVLDQIEYGYGHLLAAAEPLPDPADEGSVVRVQLGLPLIGRDGVLLRICTSNLWEDAQLVTGDFHAWLEPDGTESKVLRSARQDLAGVWPRWIVGYSPGLRGPTP